MTRKRVIRSCKTKNERQIILSKICTVVYRYTFTFYINFFYVLTQLISVVKHLFFKKKTLIIVSPGKIISYFKSMTRCDFIQISTLFQWNANISESRYSCRMADITYTTQQSASLNAIGLLPFKLCGSLFGYSTVVSEFVNGK
jgi:hypothetical protein